MMKKENWDYEFKNLRIRDAVKYTKIQMMDNCDHFALDLCVEPSMTMTTMMILRNILMRMRMKRQMRTK